jgi:outer membrane protein OmpA-like peptidoglycan-associated protein
MKKVFFIILAVCMAVSCATKKYENPHSDPEVTLTMPELYTPDLEDPNNTTPIQIAVKHPVPIKEWSIEVQPIRRQQNQQQGEQAGQAGRSQRQDGQRQTGDQQRERQPRREGSEPRQRRVFFQTSGHGAPPKSWVWDGRGTSGELVQSATDYNMTLSVTDEFDNGSTVEGTISVGIIVRRDGDDFRMAVPSIVFPPNSGDFALLSDEDMRSNRRVLNLIARALNRFNDYAIKIEGHANPTTAPNTAQRTNEETRELKPLSETRARAVMNYLVTTSGIAQSRLSVTGIGGERTVAEYDNDEENWKNRRVEFILHK